MEAESGTGIKLLIAFGRPATQYSLFRCRTLWISAIYAIFSRSPKLEALAVRLTGSEFLSRVFLNRCEIWRRVFACLCFSAVGNGFCLRREVWFFRCTPARCLIN